MATKQTLHCDWLRDGEPHGVLAVVSFEGRIGQARLTADLCEADARELGRRLVAAGIRADAMLVDSKPRRRYVGASGLPFTSSMARPWLIAHGHLSTQRGRIPDDVLAIYAKAH